MDRRSMFTLVALSGLAACSSRTSSPTATTTPTPTSDKDHGVQTIRYGTDPSQHGELSRPRGTSKGVVVVIHGGFWRSQYDLSLGRPLAASLVAHGWTAYNLEYRRVGDGGGYPRTLDDVAAGIDALSTVEDLDVTRVVTLGHSAGGHLAVWAAGRSKLTGSAWDAPAVPVTAAVSQAGVLDLARAVRDDLGAGATTAFMGAADGPRYRRADPAVLVPLDVPVRCVHGVDDDTVPIGQSVAYVQAATAAGADATLTRVEGDHFVLIDPSSPAWATTLGILADL